MAERALCLQIKDYCIVSALHPGVFDWAYNTPSQICQYTIADVFLRAVLQMSEVFGYYGALLVGAQVSPYLLLRTIHFHTLNSCCLPY